MVNILICLYTAAEQYMLENMCTQEHKQNTKILNMTNTFKEDIKKVQAEAGPCTDMASI